jgi:hypothetical protein
MWRPDFSWRLYLESFFWQRAMTAPSLRCRRIILFEDWSTTCGLERLSVQGADKRVKCSMSHPLRAVVSCVKTAHPSSLRVSIIWFSCELGPLIWGIGAYIFHAQWNKRRETSPSSLHVSILWFSCKLGPLIWGIGAYIFRAQWTSTSAVRRLWSLTGE